jgi:DNA ligase-1
MDRLAYTCEQIARWNSRLRKIHILGEYLASLSEADLSRAVRFLCCGPIQSDNRKFSVGGATLRQALLQASGWDAETLSVCYTEVGDTGETIGHLMRGISAGDTMTLADAELHYARLYKQRRVADKVELLRQVYIRYKPETLKFFVKVITGNLRIGLQAKMVEEAIAEATNTSHEEVRLANNRSGDLPRIAVAARQRRLHEMEARLFHPMEFMLAKPLDSLENLAMPSEWWIEDKYDGFRSQVHVEHGRVTIFTRGMEDVTEAFPDVVEAFKYCTRASVIDGEILAWREGRPLPFPVLQQRIARKKVTPDVVSNVLVMFIAYDILYFEGRMMIGDPIEDRRFVLAQTVSELPVVLAPQWSSNTTEEIDQAFLAARERGNEGLVIKRRGSAYEPGRRSGIWMKIKRPHGTLDVVVTAAEQGSGRRAIYLSDYTFAVRDGDRFLNVGKAYSGLTDVEVRKLTRILRGLTTERFGKVVLVKPEVVLEVAFDGVQRSPRHKSGFALRFPRILRWRKDKTMDEADTLDRVRELYETSLSGKP